MSCLGDTDAITMGSSNETCEIQCEVYARSTPSWAAPTTWTPRTIWPSDRFSSRSITSGP